MPQPDLPITSDVLASAEALAGVSYTEDERRLMLDNIGAQIEAALRRRQLMLPHDLGPATRFDPRLPGFVMPAAASQIAAQNVSDLPDADIEIAYAPVSALSTWIRAGRLSAERLVGIYLSRIERIGPLLECFALIDGAHALARARELDRLLAEGTWLGPLHGIPWGAKDILDTAGLETAWGAEPYRGRVPAKDATVVQRLHQAGAIMLGKTTVGALAYGDIWYGGRTRNPWNLEEGSSGSSAGSGAATASGLVGFALGTETLGSIVSPSHRCGVAGLRPTFGRVPRTGAMPLAWTLDKIGPMCRAVEDTALVLAAINGVDPADPFGIDAPFSFNLTAQPEGIRIGFYPADFAEEGVTPLDREVLDVARGLNLTLVELSRPALPYPSLMNLLYAECAASFEDLTLDGRDDLLTWQDADAWPNTFRKARFLSAVDHVQLDRLRRRIMQVMDDTFRQVDVIIGPSLTGPMLLITNFTGHPCLCLPVGYRESPTRRGPSLTRRVLEVADTPVGAMHTVPHTICLWGRLFDETSILSVGYALERAFRVNRRRPPVG